MSATYINVEQGSDEWHALRNGRITGSRVGAILGLSKYSKPRDVMREMIRQSLGLPNEFQETPATVHGKQYEQAAIDAYEYESFEVTSKVGFVIHPEHDWIAFSPDAIVNDNVFIEVKCPYQADYTSIEEKPEYQAQVNLGFAVMPQKECHFLIYRPEQELIKEVIHADDGSWFKRHFETLKSFHDEYISVLNSKTKQKEFTESIIVKKDDLDWHLLAQRYLGHLQKLEQLQALIEKDKEDLIELSGGVSSEGAGIRLIRSNRKGNVNYQKILADLSINVDVEKYRGASSDYWTIKQIKENANAQ